MSNSAIETDEPEDMVTVLDINPFDSKGNVRTDIDPREVKALPPQRQADFTAMLSASEGQAAAEDAEQAALRHVYACVKAEQDASNGLQAVLPIITQIEAAAAASYSARTGKPAPRKTDKATEKKIAEAGAILQKASGVLNRARQAHERAKQIAKAARSTYFEAIEQWSKGTGPKPDLKDLVHAVRQTNTEREAHAAKSVTVEYASGLDAHMGRGGRRGRQNELPTLRR